MDESCRCHDWPVNDTFARLASDNDLKDRIGLSPDGLTERYLYSPDMVFRYAFGRWWGSTDLASTAIWVLLNPATGDTEGRHRPTLERCISRSRAAGYTGLVIVNLFAFRDTNPGNLRSARDAVGPANDEVLRVITKAGAQTIAAWGGKGRLGGRSGQVGPLLDAPMCLGVTKRGEANHDTRCMWQRTRALSLGCRCAMRPARRTRDSGRSCSRPHRPRANDFELP